MESNTDSGAIAVVGQSLSHVQLFVTPWTARLPFLNYLSPRVCSNSCPFAYVMPSNHLILFRPLLLLPSIFSRMKVFSNESALCDPMDCSTSGFPVLHCLPEFAQTHIHRLSDAIWPSHPLSPSSPPAFNLFQHQGLFQWDGSSHWVIKLLELQLQHQSFQWLYSGLIYFKIDWCDLLAVQGTLKSLLQHHSRSLFSKWSESAVILSGTLSSCCWSWRRLLVLTGLALSKPPKVQEHGDSKGSWWHRLTWLLAFLREPNTIQNRTLIPHCWPRTLVQS